MFALAAWIGVLSVPVYWGHRYRVPVATTFLACAAAFSLWNDNHQIRTLHTYEKPVPFLAALDQWHKRVEADYPLTNSLQKKSLYLVAAAGGGIRAAFWTAIIIGRLEDEAHQKGRSFAAHIFALSGVSGGSLGEVVFDALLVQKPVTNLTFIESSHRLLEKDFLAGVFAKMAFADLAHRFWPYHAERYHRADRTCGLEEAWCDPWKDSR